MFVNEVTLVTLTIIVSPAVIEVVQPVSVVLVFLVADDTLGAADATMVLLTVGG